MPSQDHHLAVSRSTKPRAAAKPAPLDAQAIVDSHQSDDASELFGIADLCAEFDLSPRTLRFYETKGLLEPKRVNATRIYTRRDRARLALILRAKALGMPLAEIRHYLDLYGNHGEGRTQQLQYVVNRTAQGIQELEVKRAHIEAALAELRLINATCQRQLEERKKGRSA